ncbi:hypothetical protein BOX15_Mlig004730g1 [Macrostomum lignano]|uniref:Uncharacterized protein n=1 Tax=Macrostomum lignano TaxID=282301 RepID=A0A267EXF8_9PLAT|nr:hypothetical protein BOX15_Mlig004730g3 [Macrostomum lignano]PAA65529.1 hypothetical protein BOX15_Mlig004730g2 [Macrostomum lignano]PAA65544.1 hypothetical protein BOX15_Mlig004730g1 [Macrostomum lignano]
MKLKKLIPRCGPGAADGEQKQLEDAHESDSARTARKAMGLLYAGQFSRFADALQQNAELLRHSGCKFCDYLVADGNANDCPKLSPFCLVLLSRDDELASRAVELVDSLGLWDRVRCALFLLVDFCCSSQACSADEAQLARFFVRLSRRHPDPCARLLSEEPTADCLTPLEYAAARDCFHLATAFANAPGYLIREREHPTDPSLLVEEVDLSLYSSDGDRFLKSPFLQFLKSSQTAVGGVIPAKLICFYHSPVAQAYFLSVAHLKQTLPVAFISLFIYILIYFSLLSTMTVRIFTAGTFNSSVQVFIPSGGNSNQSYLQGISPSVVAAFKYVFYVRVAFQIFFLLIWLSWIVARVVDAHFQLQVMRTRSKFLTWLADAVSMRGCLVMEFFGILFNMLQVCMIFMELYIFSDSGSYFKQDGRLFVEATRLQVAVALNYYFTCMLELFFVSNMAGHYQVFLNLLFCMSVSMKLVLLTVVPVTLVCSTLLLSQPFIECSNYSLVCVIEYLGRSFRYAFSFASFPGIGDYVALWPQVIVFLLVAVFILNFGIALLTQQISVLHENFELRRDIVGTVWSQQYATLGFLLRRRFRTRRQKPVLLSRALPRFGTECGKTDGHCGATTCCIQNCLRHAFKKVATNCEL